MLELDICQATHPDAQYLYSMEMHNICSNHIFFTVFKLSGDEFKSSTAMDDAASNLVVLRWAEVSQVGIQTYLVLLRLI